MRSPVLHSFEDTTYESITHEDIIILQDALIFAKLFSSWVSYEHALARRRKHEGSRTSR